MSKLTQEEIKQFQERVQTDPDAALQELQARAEVNVEARAAGMAFAQLTPEFDGSLESAQMIANYLQARQQEVTVANLRNAFDVLVADGKLIPIETEEPEPAPPVQPQGLSAEDKAFRYEIEGLGADEYRRRLVFEPGFRERADRVMAGEAPVVDYSNPAELRQEAQPTPARLTTPAPVAKSPEYEELLSLSPREFLKAVDKMSSHQWRRILQESPAVVAKYESIVQPR